MTLYVGTSGYSYGEWKGAFYPNKLPAKQMLRYYSQHFTTVESNDSFRRMPTPEVLAARASEVSQDFKFALKAPMRITHFQRLKNCRESVAEMLTNAKALKKRLGPILFQLPPNFKKDVDRLGDFLKLIPRSCRIAFEFRHQTWFDEETFGVLRKRQAALCIAEAENDLNVPFVATADWGYLRLRQAEYTDAQLKKWVVQIKKQKWRDVFVFFKHEEEGKGPAMAKRFIKRYDK